MEVVHPRCAGLDLSKRDVKVCVRIQGRGYRPARATVTTCGSTTGQILALRDMLVAEGVGMVVIESTGTYWKPFYYLLEDHLALTLVNAREAKTVPGRKSDVADAEWLADLGAHGLVRAWLVPPPPIGELRDLTRTRATIARDRAREVQRLEKLLEDAQIKLSSAVTDLCGVASRRIVTRLMSGVGEPAALIHLGGGLKVALRTWPKTSPAVRRAPRLQDRSSAQQDRPAHRGDPTPREADRAEDRHPPRPPRPAHQHPGGHPDGRRHPHRRGRRGLNRIPHRRPALLLGRGLSPATRIRRPTQKDPHPARELPPQCRPPQPPALPPARRAGRCLTTLLQLPIQGNQHRPQPGSRLAEGHPKGLALTPARTVPHSPVGSSHHLTDTSGCDRMTTPACNNSRTADSLRCLAT